MQILLLCTVIRETEFKCICKHVFNRLSTWHIYHINGSFGRHLSNSPAVTISYEIVVELNYPPQKQNLWPVVLDWYIYLEFYPTINRLCNKHKNVIIAVLTTLLTIIYLLCENRVHFGRKVGLFLGKNYHVGLPYNVTEINKYFVFS